MFLQGQHTEAVIQRQPRVSLVLTAELGHVEIHRGDAGFRRLRGCEEQLRLAP